MQMANQLKDLLKTPDGEWYDGKITRNDHFNDLRDIDVALDSVQEQFTVEDRRRYTESCFGHFLQMDREMKFSGSVVHRLLLHELHHDGPEDEMRFMLGHHSVRFSKVEFCLITGLKFGVIPDTTRYGMVSNEIHEQYFSGVDEMDYEHLRVVLRIGIFEQQYDTVKLCLLYMLNWILMGFDEREKIPVWQIRLVGDLDAFDAFPWGAHMYRQSIYGFKHALDGRGEWFERLQQENGVDVHTVETYNIYGLSPALLCYDGIDEGGSLYTVADRDDVSVQDPVDHTTTGSSHTDTLEPEFNSGSALGHRRDTKGSKPVVGGGRPWRHMQVRFAMPGYTSGVHSRGDVGGHREDCLERKVQDMMDAVAALRDNLRKSDEE
ncbi:hypothetical protein Dsin_019713 [Dipteronia sinensis]|uniref:DUF1985 domain-containing protein n=1 Tax=Dipteronia sinensis TaxID=43782 RepID=A0AAE0A7S7_9ROSI|nr:hypothetical protein Dsin_019713 [Dipteronia sinensis]